MTDIYDRTTEIEEAQREDALAQHRWKRRPTMTDSARECRVCDEPIPEDRRRAVPGCSTCVDCQRDIEKAGFVDWGMAE